MRVENYESAFSIFAGGEPVLQFRGWKSSEQVAVRLFPYWCNSVPHLDLVLNVPTVSPLAYDWDQGIHGHLLQFVGSDPTRPQGAARYCHPCLRSTIADLLGLAGRASDREKIPAMDLQHWDWHWESFYGRLAEALGTALFGTPEERHKNEGGGLSVSRRFPTVPIVRAYLQGAISQLIHGGPDRSGLPLTDEALLCFQMHEIELGYPDIPRDNQLYELVKLKFIEQMDPHVDVLHTGKNDVGRFVMRVRPGNPRSYATWQPVPDEVLARNAFGCHASPLRDFREGRAWPSCFPFVTHTDAAPIIRASGHPIPPVLANRLKGVVVAFIDIEGQNVHPILPEHREVLLARGADPEEIETGETVSGDALLVTPSGQRRLIAMQTKSELLSAEEWSEQKEELGQLPGFRFQEIHEAVEMLDDVTPVCKIRYRYWYDQPLSVRHDKVKLNGGIKAVTRPCRQFWTILNGRRINVDLIVAEKTALSKGARDTLFHAMAAMAGIKQIKPDWNESTLGWIISLAMRKAGFEHWRLDDPEAGKLPLFCQDVAYVDSTGKPLPSQAALELLELEFDLEEGMQTVQVGSCIIGPVPAMRAPETEFRQSRPDRGIAFDIHGRNITGAAYTLDPEEAAVLEDTVQFVYDYADVLATG